MEDLSDKYLMMIEPKSNRENALYDDLTRKCFELEKIFRESDYRYRGFHICACKSVLSDSSDWVLPNGIITNSLFMHYIINHRSEVPQSELDKLERLFLEFNI